MAVTMYADQPAIDERIRVVLAHTEQLFERLGTPQIGRTAVIHALTHDPARVVRSTTESSSGLTPMPGQGRLVPSESHTGERNYLIARRRDPSLRDIVAQPHLMIPIQYECPDEGCRGIDGTPTFDYLEILDDAIWIKECKPRAVLEALMATHPGYVILDPETGRFGNPTIEAAAAMYGLRFAYVVAEDLDKVWIRNEAYLDRAYWAGPMPDVEVEPIVEIVRRRRLGVPLGELIATGVADPLVLQRLIVHGQLFVDREVHFVGEPDHVPVYVSAAVAAADAHRVTPGWAIWRRPTEVRLRPGDRLVWHRVAYAVENVGEPKVTLRLGEGTLRVHDRREIEGLIRTGDIIVVSREQVEEHPGRAEADAVYLRATDKSWRTAERRANLVGRYLADPKRQVPKGTSRASLERWMARQRVWLERTGDGYVGFFPDSRPGNPRDGLAPGIRQLMLDTIEKLYFGVTTRTTQKDILGEIWRAAIEQHLWPSADEQRARWARKGSEAAPAKLGEAPVGPRKPGKKPRGPVSERTLRLTIQALRTRANLVSALGDRLAYVWKPWGDVDPEGIPVHGDSSMSVGHVDWTELDLEGVSDDFSCLGRFWLGRYLDASSGVVLGRYLSFDPPRGAHTLELFRRVAVKWGTICDLTVMDLGAEHRFADGVMFALRYGKELRWRPKRAGRAGNAVEGPWWALDVQLLYKLVGNTQPTKRARTMTRATNPRLHALWRLYDFEELLDRYDAIAEARPRPIDNLPRREALDRAFLVHGRPPADIGGDPLLPFFTSASVDLRQVHIHQPNGVQCDGLDYWHPLLDVPALEGRAVNRRRLLGDVSRLWVQVEGPIDVVAARRADELARKEPDGTGYGPVLGLPNADAPDRVPAVWVEARCRPLVSIRVASQKELEILSQEIPELVKARRRGADEYGLELARVLASARETEASRAARKKAEAVAAAPKTPQTAVGTPPAVLAVTHGLGYDRPSRLERLRASRAQDADV